MRQIAALIFIALAACGTADGSSPNASNPTPALSAGVSGEPLGGSMRFDALTLTLELKRTTVPSGGTIGSDLVVRNETDEPIVDPGCLLGSTSSGLVPEDDPGAHLWQVVIVDCAGEFRMEPGFSDTFTGPDFRARTMEGDPLPPGDYYAAVEIDGRTERLLVPVEVTVGD